jgi:hypothetical protein
MERGKLANTTNTYPVNTKSGRAPVKRHPCSSRRQRNSYAATAALTISRRASSSDAIGAPESVFQ